MKEPKNALGRGLDALIPSGPADAVSTGIMELDIDRISPNRYQPRDAFDAETLGELAQSIRENGIIQPLVLRRQGEDFQIVAGERRWRAAQMAGLQRVPAVIKHVTDDKLLEVALVENVQRQDLSPLETAKALRLLLDEHGLTQEELASRVGLKRPTLTNYLRLLGLAEPVKQALEAGRIDMGHARALTAVSDPGRQAELCQATVKGSLSVRRVERLVQEEKGRGPASPKTTKKPAKDPNVAAAERRLQAALGSTVNIVRGARGAGKIQISFRSDDELDRLFERLVDDRKVAAETG